MCRKITSHVANFSLRNGGAPAAASFSYKIGGGGKDLATLLATVLTWSGYWKNPDFPCLVAYPIFVSYS